MSNPNQQPTAIFVADCHFHLDPDSEEQKRVDRFCQLLELAREVDHLILLGDIFDFWFDYPHFRLRGFEPVLQALDQVKAAGTRIHFIGGNHDIWAAQYMHQRYGSSPDGETEILQLGSKRFLLTHGDGLLGYDWAYNTFRSIVRTRAGIVLAKSLHPEILYSISEWLSGTSRSANRDEAPQIEAKGKVWLEKNASDDWDLMLMGHVHHPFTVTVGDRSLAALAGWFGTLGYAVWQDGQFRLLNFETDPLPRF